MYAVIKSGGKQYRVQPGDIVELEKLEGEVGAKVKFDQILFAATPDGENVKVNIGKPMLSGATVDGEIVGQGRGEKVMIVKMKRRKQYRRTQGHRQFQTQVLVTGVSNGAGGSATLSADDKKTKLEKFHSYLKPKGPAFSTPILGSRKRLAAMKNAASGKSEKAEAAATTKKAPAAKKTTAKKKA